MADGILTRAGARVGARHLRTRTATVQVLVEVGLIYVGARLVTSALLLLAAWQAGPGTRFGPDAGVADFVVGWDARWYWMIATVGYPTELPVTDAGTVAENAWAFMPVYAWVAALVGWPFGAWGVGALVVSIVAGYVASVVLYRMLEARLGRGATLWAVAFFAAGPLAALFQVGYAESLFMLWLLLALHLVMTRRYAWLYLLVPLMGYTRPGVLAFALFLALHGIHRFVFRRREALPVRDGVHIVLLGLLATAIGFSWQVFAALATGDPGAYLATELAWRRNWIGGHEAGFVPLEGFVEGAAFWFRLWGAGEVVGYLVLGATVAVIGAALVWAPTIRRLGVDLRLWTASYLVYLLLVFFPQSSLFRLLLPISPLVGALAAPRSVAWRIAVLVAGLAAQWWWIWEMYANGNTYWRIP